MAALGAAWFPPHVGAPAVVEYGEGLESVAATAYPALLPYLELEQKVFDIADELGIGDEVRILYYSIATGQRTGAVLTTVVTTAPVISGSAVASLAGAISSIASVVGIVLGVISFFSSDDDQEQAKKRLHAKVEQILKRQSIDDMIAEQHELSQSTTLSIDDIKAQIKAGTTIGEIVARTQQSQAAAAKLETLLRALKQKLTPDELALFVSVSNLGRWDAYYAAWNGMKQSQRDAVRENDTDLGAWLEKRIASETATMEALGAELAKKNVQLARYPQRATTSSAWLIGLGLLALAGAAGVYFLVAPSAARALGHSAARGAIHLYLGARRAIT